MINSLLVNQFVRFTYNDFINDLKQLGDCIGKGGYGSVYRGLNIQNGQVVAIKQIHINGISKSEIGLIMVKK